MLAIFVSAAAGCIVGNGIYCYSEDNTCPVTHMLAIETKQECRAVLDRFCFPSNDIGAPITDQSSEGYPRGCFGHGNGASSPYFNSHIDADHLDNDKDHVHVFCKNAAQCAEDFSTDYIALAGGATTAIGSTFSFDCTGDYVASGPATCGEDRAWDAPICGREFHSSYSFPTLPRSLSNACF